MVLARLRIGDWIAGAWALLLLGAMFVDWYEADAGATATAWEAFGLIDVLLALLVALVLALVVVTARSTAPPLPVALGVIACAFAAIILLVVLYRHINEPGPNAIVSVGAGAYLGLLSTAGVFIGTWLSIRDERMPAVPPDPTPEVLPAPPA